MKQRSSFSEILLHPCLSVAPGTLYASLFRYGVCVRKRSFNGDRGTKPEQGGPKIRYQTEGVDESSNLSAGLPPLPSTVGPVADRSRKESEELKEIRPSSTESPLGSPTTAAAPISDLQKKVRRAERFGMSVQLSEQEKRNSRAERFGTGFTLNASDEVKELEEQKRKARIERFGLLSQSAVDVEAKKKVRLTRFASISKKDSQEEDRMKARPIRKWLLWVRPAEEPENQSHQLA